MKHFIFFTALAALIGFAVACENKLSTSPDEEIKDVAEVNVAVNTSLFTKAGQVDGTVNTLELFVYDSDVESQINGRLEYYKKLSGEEIPSAGKTLGFTISKGLKHFYVVINGRAIATDERLTENSLLNYNTLFTENLENNLVMVGGKTVNLVGGETANVAISCRRLMSKISVGTITPDFVSPSLVNSNINVDAVYLMNVPKVAKLINGATDDVFGIHESRTALQQGDEGYPSGFEPAVKDGASLPFYKYPAPEKSASASNGYYNFYDKTKFPSTKKIDFDNASKSLTVKEINQAIYPSSPVKDIEVDKNFYTFPNPEAPAAAAGELDYVTRFVIEATATVGEQTQKTFYSISLPYTQPNYHYTIESIILKGLGTSDPTVPVERASCEFTLNIRDWDTGKIVGTYNNQVSDGVFEF